MMDSSKDDTRKSLAWTVLSVGIALMIGAIFLFIQIIDTVWVQKLVSLLGAIVFFFLGLKVIKIARKILHTTKRTKR